MSRYHTGWYRQDIPENFTAQVENTYKALEFEFTPLGITLKITMNITAGHSSKLCQETLEKGWWPFQNLQVPKHVTENISQFLFLSIL